MRYTVENATKPLITSVGRMDRKEAYQLVVALPRETKRKLEELIEGGSVSAAVAGLVMYALDEIEAKKQKLMVRNN